MPDVVPASAPPPRPRWWSRVLATPLGELRHGRVTRRGCLVCVPSRLARTELPDEAVKYIHRVSRQASVRWYERQRVIDDLVAEFRNHVASPEQPTPYPLNDRRQRRALAKALRREQIVRRHPADRFAFRALYAASWSALALIVAFPLYIAAGRPTPTVDYLAKLNATAAAVPEEQRAWPVYREVLLALTPDQRGPNDQPPRNDFHDYGRHPRDPLWPMMRAHLESHPDILGKIRDASQRYGLGYIVRPEGEYNQRDRALWRDNEASAGGSDDNVVLLRDIPLPHLGSLRHLARLKASEAYASAEDHDADRFVEAVETMLAISGHVAEPPLLLCSLAALAIENEAFDVVDDPLRSNASWLSQSHLRRLADIADAHSSLDLLRVSGDFDAARDWVQHAFTDDGHGNGRITRQGMYLATHFDFGDEDEEKPHPLLREIGNTVAACYFFIRGPSRVELLGTIDTFECETLHARLIPAWEDDQRRTLETYEGVAHTDPMVDVMLATVLPYVSGIHATAHRVDARRQGVRVAIALHRYRAAHGVWPASLDALVTAFLDAVPPDPADGRPMRYRLGDDGPVLYSLGADGDDDGGVIAEPVPNDWRDLPPESLNDYAGRFGDEDPVDGDWLLFPTPEPAPAVIPDPSDDALGIGGFGLGGMGMNRPSDVPEATDDANNGGP